MRIYPTSQKFGEIIPDVFIGQINISESSDFIKNKDNSYTKRRKDRSRRHSKIQKGLEGKNDDSQIKININLILKEVVEKGPKGKAFWFKRKGRTYSNLKIRIVQSLSRTATKNIMSDPGQIFNRGFFTKHADTSVAGAAAIIQYKDIGVNSNLKPLGDYIVNRTQNFIFCDIPYNVVFNLQTSDPQHLAYFAVCYSDTVGNNLDSSKRLLNSSFGKIVSEIVINAGELVPVSEYFTLNGQCWKGPIHTGPTGIYLAGLYSPAKKQVLQVASIANVKVRDLRVLKEFQNIKSSLFDQPPDTFRRGNHLIRGDRKIKHLDRTYFTDAFISRGQDGVVKFLFGIDFEKIFQQKSYFSSLYNSNDQALKMKVLKKSKFMTLKIKRKRVNLEMNGIDSFGYRRNAKKFTYDSGADVVDHDVITIHDIVIGKLGVNTNFKNVDSNGKIIGRMRPKKLSVDNAGLMYFFEVEDHEIKNISEGLYQYSIEFDIRDRTENVFKIRLLKLIKARHRLEQYISRINNLVVYNPTSKKNDIRAAQSATSARAPWTSTIQTLVSAIEIFMGHNRRITKKTTEKLVMLLYSMSCPACSNPSDVQMVLKVVDDFIMSFLEYLDMPGGMAYYNHYRDNPGLRTGTRVDNLSNFTIQHDFGNSISGQVNRGISSSIIDASIDPKVGYIFMDPRNAVDVAKYEKSSHIYGFKKYSVSDLGFRVKAEISRYFKIQPTDLSIKVNNVAYTTRDFINTDIHRYWAPAMISLGNQKYYDILGEDNIFNDEKNISLLLDILDYNINVTANDKNSIRSLNFENKLDVLLTHRSLTRLTSKEIEQEDGDFLIKKMYTPGENYFSIMSQAIFSGQCTDDEDLIEVINSEEYDLNTSGKLRKGIKKIPTRRDGSNIMLALIGTSYLNILDPIKRIQNFNLKNPINVLTFLDKIESKASAARNKSRNVMLNLQYAPKTNSSISRNKQELIKELPFQVKTLLLDNIKNITKYNFTSLNQNQGNDPMEDVNKFAMFWILYGQLVELQILDSFEYKKGHVLVKQANWIPATSSAYGKAVKRGSTLCRLVRYKNPHFFGNYPELLDMPIVDEYFYLEGVGTKAGITQIKSKNISAAAQLAKRLHQVYVKWIDTEYLTTNKMSFQRAMSSQRRKKLIVPPLPAGYQVDPPSRTLAKSSGRAGSGRGGGMGGSGTGGGY